VNLSSPVALPANSIATKLLPFIAYEPEDSGSKTASRSGLPCHYFAFDLSSITQALMFQDMTRGDSEQLLFPLFLPGHMEPDNRAEVHEAECSSQ
jgi:hypothetical protein